MSTLHSSRARVELDVQPNSLRSLSWRCMGSLTEDWARRPRLSCRDELDSREQREGLCAEAENRACGAAQAQSSRLNFSVVSLFIELATVYLE